MEPTLSNIHADVAFRVFVVSSGLRPEDKFLTKTCYRLDALVELKGTKVGTEVDSPSHFVGRKAMGVTLLKCRQVKTPD
jgi:hypothetical protein